MLYLLNGGKESSRWWSDVKRHDDEQYNGQTLNPPEVIDLISFKKKSFPYLALFSPVDYDNKHMQVIVINKHACILTIIQQDLIT